MAVKMEAADWPQSAASIFQMLTSNSPEISIWKIDL
jgi:hypothetical protein